MMAAEHKSILLCANIPRDKDGPLPWCAMVWWDGKWHKLGYWHTQNEAERSASKVWHSLHGSPSGLSLEKTEELPKLGVNPRAQQGVIRNKTDPLYPNMGAPVTPPISCLYCGADLYGKRSTYCSARCRQAAYRQRSL